MSSPLPQSLNYRVKPRRNWRRIVLRVFLVLGVSGVVLATVLLLLVWYLFGEKLFSTRSADAVVTGVMNHTLVPNAGGIVTLPPPLASYSQDGNVYVTIDPAGTTWILFPTWRGKGDNVAAYVYHSVPAIGPPPAQVTLTGPDLRAGAAMLPYTVDRAIDGNWYHVSWEMD